MVCCVHHIPGRARFKIEALRRDPELAVSIHEQVGALQGVTSVEINRHAASIIVYYRPETSGVDAITDHICAHCPKANLNRRVDRGAAQRPAPIPPKVAHAMRDAASRAVVSSFINRALEQSFSGLAIGPR